MDPLSSPIRLDNSLEQVADHEAGHIVVAHARGMNPSYLFLYEVGPTHHEGHADYAKPCDAEGSPLQTMNGVLVAFAGFLAQAKGAATRAAVEPVTFDPSQNWQSLADYLFRPATTTPSIVFMTSSRRRVVISARGLQSMEDDLTKASSILTNLANGPISSAHSSLAECSQLLDRHDVWKGIETVAERVKAAAPIKLRRLLREELFRALGSVRRS